MYYLQLELCCPSYNSFHFDIAITYVAVNFAGSSNFFHNISQDNNVIINYEIAV